MKMLALVVALAAGAMSSAAVAAAAPTAAAQTYSVETTSIGVLLDNPKTKAVLDAEIPGLSTHSNINAAREMTLRAVQPYAPDLLTEERLKKTEAALKALPAK